MRRAIAIAISLLSLSAVAQVADPMRPADMPIADGSSSSLSADNSSGLQAIIVRPDKKRSTALIAGQTVRLGSKVGEKRVVKIIENQVTLQGDDGPEVLRLTPSIQKTPVAKKPRAATHHVKQLPTGISKK
ncbi:MAG: hypothetical protein Q7T94_12530 [Rugosibacter sp.]|nr:hypothetical protein [Rugosibacter sp.]